MIRTKVILYGDQYTLCIIFDAVLLRMGNILGKLYRENQTQNFVFNNVFFKIVVLMR
jgi:hypothetical protein